jgi:hypothetical protein
VLAVLRLVQMWEAVVIILYLVHLRLLQAVAVEAVAQTLYQVVQGAVVVTLHPLRLELADKVLLVVLVQMIQAQLAVVAVAVVLLVLIHHQEMVGQVV